MSWAPPSLVPGAEEGPGQPLACLATTYTFSAELFEAELLPRFVGLEFDPNEREPAFLVEREDALERVTAAVLVDQHKVDIRQTTLRWDQLSVRVPHGIQHAKVTLLAWERLVRLIIGSANLTVPGYRHNREVVGVLDFFDHRDSTPREVLDAALRFLDEVLGFAAADPRVLARVRGALKSVASRVGRWGTMPREFSPREYPKVHFVPTMPGRSGGVAKSTLKQVKELWGNRAARDIRVVTPFVGNPDARFDRLVEELASIRRLGSADVFLAAPGVKSEAGAGKRVLLPLRFRDAWAGAWERSPEALDVCVVTPDADHRGRPVSRPLHAKGVFVGDGDMDLLCCGSSNFSASGMGVRAANVEANLCYVDRAEPQLDGAGLADRMPVDWERDRAARVEWPAAVEPTEEDAEDDGPAVPPVFRWATFDPASARLVIGLNADEPLPEVWSIRQHHPGSAVLLSNDLVPVFPPEGRLLVSLSPELAQAPVTTLRLSWTDHGALGEALLPVNAEDHAKLPPPESLRSLTAEAILACLLSGCSPAEWVDRELARRSGGSGDSPQSDPSVDPHRFHDPSGMALYRVRRLGRALATMGRRLSSTVRTPEAVEYQVHRHPLGPVQLAEALVREAQVASAGTSRLELARLAFSLLEIGLMLAFAGRRLHGRRRAGEADHRDCLRRAVWRVLRMAEQVFAADAAVGVGGSRGSESLRRYRRNVEQQATELLGVLQTEEAVPCP